MPAPVVELRLKATMKQDSSLTPSSPLEQRAHDLLRLLESLPQWAWTATAEGLIDYFSPHAAAFTGLSEDQLTGSGWTLGLHPDDRERVARGWSDAFATRSEFDIELRLRHRDGGYRWLLWRGVPTSVDDPVARWAGTTLDITERRAREERTATDLRTLKET